LGVLTKYINNIPKYVTGPNNSLDEYAGYIQTYNQYVSQMDKKEQKIIIKFLKKNLWMK